MTRRLHPLPTRRLASAAWRRHIAEQRLAFAALRRPDPEEVPLSPAEVSFGLERGLIRAPIHHQEN